MVPGTELTLIISGVMDLLGTVTQRGKEVSWRGICGSFRKKGSSEQEEEEMKV